MKKTGKKRAPVPLAVVLAMLLLAGVGTYSIYDHLAGTNSNRSTGAGDIISMGEVAHEHDNVDDDNGNDNNSDKGTGDTGGNNQDLTASLSNTKRGWGLKRNSEHRQPEVPSYITKEIEKYGSCWIGSPDRKEVYLTFDQGYEKGYTGTILDILRDNEVKAAFFVTGHYLRSKPELVKRMVEEGHIIGNHTDNHPSMPDISDEQIEKEIRSLEKLYEEITGRKDMKYLRPPKGEYSERTLALTRQMGYHNIFWSMAMVDWVPMPGGPQEAYQTVMDNLHNGAVILLHSVSGDNAQALDRIIKDSKEQGYIFKTLDELVPVPGA